MSTLYLAVSFIARPGQEAALLSALRELVEPSRADDGCLQYDLHADREDPRHFFLYEAWRDDASWHAHRETDHLKGFAAEAPALVEARRLHQLSRL